MIPAVEVEDGLLSAQMVSQCELEPDADSSVSDIFEDDLVSDHCVSESEDENGVDFSVLDQDWEFETDIAREFYRLSPQERERCLYDLHGVADEIKETPDFVETKIVELEKHLAEAKKSKKLAKAYNEALEQSSEYVQRQSFQLMFLRSNEFDSEEAANQMLLYFECKLELFGNEKLCKDILLDDLNDYDRRCLDESHVTLLNERDPAGRPILLIVPALANRDKATFENTARGLFYYLMVLAEDDSCQRRGCAAIVYNLTHEKLNGQEPIGLLQELARVKRATPVRQGSLHICFDSPIFAVLFSFVSRFMLNSREKTRMRVHRGSRFKVFSELMTFGIPTTKIPISADGSFDRTAHHGYIRARQRMEVSGETQAAKVVAIPRDHDVLFGRGKGVQFHKGNLRLRVVIESHYKEYEQCRPKSKTKVALEVLSYLKSKGSRFLHQKEGVWVDVDDEKMLLQKVMHGFRDLRRTKAKKDESTTAVSDRKQEISEESYEASPRLSGRKRVPNESDNISK